MTTSAQISAIKSRLGPLTFLDFSGDDLTAAHRKLGAHVKIQAQSFLKVKLDHLNSDQFLHLLYQARACLAELGRRAKLSSIAKPVRLAMQEYLACLSAWSEGGEFSQFQHPLLKQHNPSPGSITPTDLAMFLQHDNTGCQTGLYRLADGSVTLWHTEEDEYRSSGSRFDQLRIAAFPGIDGNRSTKVFTFIYPDLLPGPAFGWSLDGYVQTSDTLILKPYLDHQVGTLSNVAAWITLFLGGTFPHAGIIQALSPFFDGYALNAVYPKDGRIIAEKIEFARDQIISQGLREIPGSYLFQVNIFSQPHDRSLRQLENLNPEQRKNFQQRIWRLNHEIRQTANTAPLNPQYFLKLVSSRAGGRWAFANLDVKAYLISQISPTQMTNWLGPGSALKGDPPHIFQYELGKRTDI